MRRTGTARARGPKGMRTAAGRTSGAAGIAATRRAKRRARASTTAQTMRTTRTASRERRSTRSATGSVTRTAAATRSGRRAPAVSGTEAGTGAARRAARGRLGTPRRPLPLRGMKRCVMPRPCRIRRLQKLSQSWFGLLSTHAATTYTGLPTHLKAGGPACGNRCRYAWEAAWVRRPPLPLLLLPPPQPLLLGAECGVWSVEGSWAQVCLQV
mmetsp:Transcript_19028/g.40989  ORF Transcript_19028/g.40989 Transcript_19028/m.40989 type:complete len:212 (+) Transcript_19028:2653-3288(+)